MVSLLHQGKDIREKKYTIGKLYDFFVTHVESTYPSIPLYNSNQGI
jgi:hypothetical protein